MDAIVIDALAANDGSRRFTRDAIGVGPRLISGILEKHGYSVTIIRAEDFIEGKDSYSSSELFLISAMSVDFTATKKVITKIHKIKENKSLIILGGPIASEIEAIEILSPDIAVIGEGENILQALITKGFSINKFELEDENFNHFKISKKGKTWILSNNFHDPLIFEKFSPSIERTKDYPDYQYSKVYVEVVRGCSNHYRGELVRSKGKCINCGNCDDVRTVKQPNCPVEIPPGCGFCSVPSIFGPPRSKKEETILEEVTNLFEIGVRRIVLSAPGFLDYMRNENDKPLVSPSFPTANIKAIKSLLSKLAQIRDKYDDRSIAIENVKPTLVTEEIAEIIGTYLPNTNISIGCETFDAKHSTAIGRPATPQDSVQAAKWFKKYGIHPQIYLIHSLPGETPASLNITINTIKRHLWNVADKITIYKYQELPLSPFKVVGVEKPQERYLLKKKRDELKNVIIEFNRRKKRELIGKILKAVGANYDEKHKSLICYPLFGGPTITIPNPPKKKLKGKVLEVKITEVIGDKLIKGRIEQLH